jgi:hypothetical protein
MGKGKTRREKTRRGKTRRGKTRRGKTRRGKTRRLGKKKAKQNKGTRSKSKGKKRGPNVVISQPRKRKSTFRRAKLGKGDKTRFHSLTFKDSSMFSSGTGRKPRVRRKAVFNEQRDNMRRGAFMLQNDDKILYGKYPN